MTEHDLNRLNDLGEDNFERLVGENDLAIYALSDIEEIDMNEERLIGFGNNLIVGDKYQNPFNLHSEIIIKEIHKDRMVALAEVTVG